MGHNYIWQNLQRLCWLAQSASVVRVPGDISHHRLKIDILIVLAGRANSLVYERNITMRKLNQLAENNLVL